MQPACKRPRRQPRGILIAKTPQKRSKLQAFRAGGRQAKAAAISRQIIGIK